MIFAAWTRRLAPPKDLTRRSLQADGKKLFVVNGRDENPIRGEDGRRMSWGQRRLPHDIPVGPEFGWETGRARNPRCIPAAILGPFLGSGTHARNGEQAA